MKVTINFDCTAEEARTFLGLPDVSPLNEKYVQATLNTMEGATNLEQMDKLLRSFSPFGEAGMRLFGQMMNMGEAGPRTDKIGRASWGEECGSTCRSRGWPD